jgi:hypothetical protein
LSKNIDIEIVDFLDLINHTLSNAFTEKWRHKYSEKFIKHFQLKLLDSMNRQKPIKKEMLYNYLNTIDIDIYKPFIFGSLKKTS